MQWSRADGTIGKHITFGWAVEGDLSPQKLFAVRQGHGEFLLELSVSGFMAILRTFSIAVKLLAAQVGSSALILFFSV